MSHTSTMLKKKRKEKMDSVALARKIQCSAIKATDLWMLIKVVVQ